MTKLKAKPFPLNSTTIDYNCVYLCVKLNTVCYFQLIFKKKTKNNDTYSWISNFPENAYLPGSITAWFQTRPYVLQCLIVNLLLIRSSDLPFDTQISYEVCTNVQAEVKQVDPLKYTYVLK